MSTAQHDLQILSETSDDELRARVRARHPKWSDEVVESQIRDLRSQDFAEWYTELFIEKYHD